MGVRLDWKGDNVRRKVETACKLGIDQTMAVGVRAAKTNVHVVTSILQGSIKVVEFARPIGTGFRGRWGSADVVYGIYEELLHPWLRPAADTAHRGLSSAIKGNLK